MTQVIAQDPVKIGIMPCPVEECDITIDVTASLVITVGPDGLSLDSELGLDDLHIHMAGHGAIISTREVEG